MAISNDTGAIVFTTGNKSEMATGYSTLYGDSAGGFAVIKDVSKTLVYELCRYRNEVAVEQRRLRANSPDGVARSRRRPNCVPTSSTISRCRPTTNSTRCSSSTSRATRRPKNSLPAATTRRWCCASRASLTRVSTSGARCRPGCGSRARPSDGTGACPSPTPFAPSNKCDGGVPRPWQNTCSRASTRSTWAWVRRRAETDQLTPTWCACTRCRRSFGGARALELREYLGRERRRAVGRHSMRRCSTRRSSKMIPADR
jgi:hypothetical protein